MAVEAEAEDSAAAEVVVEGTAVGEEAAVADSAEEGRTSTVRR